MIYFEKKGSFEGFEELKKKKILRTGHYLSPRGGGGGEDLGLNKMKFNNFDS